MGIMVLMNSSIFNSKKMPKAFLIAGFLGIPFLLGVGYIIVTARRWPLAIEEAERRDDQ